MANLAPGVHRLSHYDRAWLRGDVVGGLTVAAYLVPQVMAYAEVAGLPAVAGLWATVGALTVYAVLGSSPQLSVGPESTTALMTAAAIGPLAAGDPGRYASLAAAAALVVAALCLVGWVARLGFLADLLSKPVLVGYMAGVAVLMIVGQLTTATGVAVAGEGTLGELWHFATHAGEAHGRTVLVTATVLVFLFAGTWRWKRAPMPLIAIIAAALAVRVAGWHDDLLLVGQIPGTLPRPRMPAVGVGDLTDLLLPAVGVTLVSYTDNALTGRAFAARHGDRIDANQELLALGGANLAAGALQGFPVSSSGSRTVIADSLGSRSQLHSLVAVALVLVTLLALGPMLATFPRAALAGVVIWAAVRLVDVRELRRIAHFRRSELALALATTAGVLAIGILYGVLLAVGLSVLDLVRRVARPHDGVLGYVPGLAGMHDIDDYPEARQVPGLVVYRYDSPLFFANAENFHQRALASLDLADGSAGAVEWMVLNFEANVHIDLTSVDALFALHHDLRERGVTLALSRVKYEMREKLEKAGLVARIGVDHIFPTLPTAVVAYVDWYTAEHGRPPSGVTPPDPPTPPGFT